MAWLFALWALVVIAVSAAVIVVAFIGFRRPDDVRVSDPFDRDAVNDYLELDEDRKLAVQKFVRAVRDD